MRPTVGFPVLGARTADFLLAFEPWRLHREWPTFPHMVYIKINSLLGYLRIVVESDSRVVCTVREGQNIVGLDLPNWNLDEM